MANGIPGQETYQEGDRTGGKHGIKGATNRLWSDEYGGGFLGRETIPAELWAQMQQQAMGQGPSAAEILMRAGLGQQQAQAYGLAASGQGTTPALAMRQAQQTASQAGLQSQAQFGAMRADEMARAQQLWAQSALQQQAMNDAAAAQRESLLQGYVGQKAGIQAQQDLQNSGWWQQILGGAMGGAIGGLASGATSSLFGKAPVPGT